ncbi:MAG: hypothetical protein JWM37_147 [Candidatus Saccharibacteria bacterium]|nr:hypothetical protein [Candidatus Saccharibacteria bacterium]
MYFSSRVEAGQLLAEQLATKYRFENSATIALDDGGVMIGAQIAAHLHTSLSMLLADQINLPMETLAIGGIGQDGSFTYNSTLSHIEIEEYVSEYYGYLEQEKLQKMHHMNELLGSGGLIRKDMLRGHNVILVSDGLMDPMSLDLAFAFLKPVRTTKVIVATPVATVQAVDRMHVLADEIFCLNVIDSGLPKEHYYDQKDVPDHATIVKTLEEIILKWR